MTVLDRHLMRLVLVPTLIGTALTLLVYSAFALASLLRDSALASAPIGKLLLLVGVRDLIALQIILPSVFFLSMIMALGAWHRDREAYACYANGVAPPRVERPLILLAALVAAIVAGLAMGARPWSYQLAYKLEERMTDLTSEVLQSGTFYRWSDQLVLRADAVDETAGADAPRLLRVFAAQRDGASFRIIRAARAHISNTGSDRRQTLEFLDGTLHELDTADGSRRVTAFESLVYQTNPGESRRAMHRRTQPIARLLNSPLPKDRAEAQWRMTLPVVTFLIGLIAIRLGHVRPLQSTYGRLALGIAIYVIIFNGVNLLTSAIEQEQLPSNPGLYLMLPLLLVFTFLLSRMPAFTLRPSP
ncbi:MAG: LptF/LptG family permease [Pseudomonadales bacterium]